MQSSDVQSHQISLFTALGANVSAYTQFAQMKSSAPATRQGQAAHIGPSNSAASARMPVATVMSAKSPMMSMSLGSSNNQRATRATNLSSNMQSESSFFEPSHKFTTKTSGIAHSRVNTMNIKMTAGVDSIQPSQYIKKSLNEMKANGARQRRSSVVMEAVAKDSATDAPTVSGQVVNDHLQEGFQDMMFYHNQYVTLANVEHYTGNKYVDELMATAKKLATPGKGILASDESTGTIGNRFEQIGVENTHENRIAYRSLLFHAPEINNYISGAILYDETTRDSDENGKKFIELLKEKNIVPGIKIDIGMTVINGTIDETATMGLDGMNERAKEYYDMGVRFAKWRAVIKIDEATGCPSEQAIQETAHSLARYGSICQHAGLVPIIEPEILSDGSHSIQKCAEVSERVYNAVQSAIISNQLIQEGLLWKPNMVTQGSECKDPTSPEEVAFYTVRTLSRTIPPSVPGITFLSGGQPEETASQNLNAINKLAFPKHPWNMSFSFGRALQTTVLKEWKGKPEGVAAAQAALLERCKANGVAALGTYEGGAGSTQSDFVANYKY